MLKAVRDHALAHYGAGQGWDYVVEAWTDEEILKAIADAGAITEAEAIWVVGVLVGVVADYEKDIRGWGGELDDVVSDPIVSEPEESCDGCGAVGRFYDGLCYECQCAYHAEGAYDMDGSGWR